MSSRRFDHAAARKHYQDAWTARAGADAAALAKQADTLVNRVVTEVQKQIDGQGLLPNSSNEIKFIILDGLRRAADIAVARLNSEEFNCPARVSRCHEFRCDCNDDQGCRWCICVAKFWDPTDQ